MPKVLLLYKMLYDYVKIVLTLKLLVDFLENNVFYGNCTGGQGPPL